jgi:NADH dehydrogenase
VGSDICRRLAAAGKSTRALVRVSSDPGKVGRLESLGVETIQGDVRDRASLDRVCQGVDAVICTVSSMPFSYEPGVNDIQATDLDGVTNLIEAARANAVSHFIYTSISGNADLEFPLRNAKREVEQRVKGSGMAYTILRPSFFMEVWLSPAVGFDAANAKAAIPGDGQNPISWISLQDVAQFAVACLDQPAARDAVLELGGPQALSPREVVQLFEQAGGRPFELQFIPGEALEAQQAAATDPMQQSFSALMRCYAMGDPMDMSVLPRTFEVELTSMEDHIRRALAVA